MIYYTIGKNKDISGKNYYNLDLFSSRKAALLFVEKYKNIHMAVAAGSIDLEKKVEHCSGWQPELGDSLAVLRAWAKCEERK